MKLTEKQKRFCDYYIETGNATQAAIMAGYSEKTAGIIGSENLKKPYISEYVEKQLAELKNDRIADQQEILEFLSSVVRGQAKSATLIGVGGGAEEIEKEMPPTMVERVRASELLGKRYAMWTDKQEINANVTPVFVDDIGGE